MGRRPKYTQVQKIKNDLTDAFNRANGIEAAEIFGMLFEVLNEQKAKITPSVVVTEPEPVLSIESYEKLSLIELMQLQGRLNRLAMRKRKDENNE
ncbi:MAG: hypothetical protein LLG05_15845 [Porphyromonadaceae bacterium]|jgi:hypothetical protein|nr:hypothetical protein [uncultured Macellibacteroides sp.]MCE5227315.1 hypothetical protein [Porphyromonadaceae bacterium]